MHEDFKTLKEEVQRETQEVEKLSPVGQSSLLTSLSNLLGKKKELQDLEQTVRCHGGNGKRGRKYERVVAGPCGWGGELTVLQRLWSPWQILSQGWTSLPRLLGHHRPLIPGERASVQRSQKAWAPSDGQRVATGQCRPLLDNSLNLPELKTQEPRNLPDRPACSRTWLPKKEIGSGRESA